MHSRSRVGHKVAFLFKVWFGWSGMSVVRLLIILLVVVSGVFAGGEVAGEKATTLPIPTHANAAMIVARNSGFFDQYVAGDATLTECVAFLNRTGIYFGLAEVVAGKEFSVKDCARVMGQLELVFSGDAEYVGGKVILPRGIGSWVEFCVMHNVYYIETYRVMREMLYVAQESK